MHFIPVLDYELFSSGDKKRFMTQAPNYKHQKVNGFAKKFHHGVIVFFLPFFLKFLTLNLGIGTCSAQSAGIFGSTNLSLNSTGTTADPSAILDISGTGLGLLIPRMTFANRPVSPVTGLLIYQTNSTPGFYYYDGSSWVQISSGTSPWTRSAPNVYLATGTDNVGIGTSIPLFKLAVQANDNSNIASFGHGSNARLELRPEGSSQGVKMAFVGASGADKFYISPPSGCCTDVVFESVSYGDAFEFIPDINSAGGMIITKNPGGTAPKNMLDVVGSAAMGTFGGVNVAPANGLIVSGNVGIGNSSPAELLDVAGRIRIGALSAPGTPTDKLYNVGGNLFWNGTQLNSSSPGWSTTGNASTVDGTHFIGTTDDIPLNFRVNNQKAGRIENTNANTFFGYQSGSTNSGTGNSVFGNSSLVSNTTSGNNVAIGSHTLFTQSYSNGGSPWNTDNVAIGAESMYFNQPTTSTNGRRNTAAGAYSLKQNTIGTGNSAFGYSALTSNTSASRNIAIGYSSLSTQSFSNGSIEWFSDNIAIGYGALTNNQPTSTTEGYRNIAIGSFSLNSNTTGAKNTAVGYLALNVNSIGNYNNSFGSDAMGSNTTAGRNLAFGNSALYSQSYNNGGVAWNSDNVAVGYEALFANQPTTNANGIQNTAIGNYALTANTTGILNTASGYQSLYSNNTGTHNTATGSWALYTNQSGIKNTATGVTALGSNNNGSYNTAMGYSSLYANISGTENTAVGHLSLTANTGNYNTAVGKGSLQSNVGTDNNTAIGTNALFSNNGGANNTALGFQAGYTITPGNANTTGSNNTFIGYNAGPGTATQLSNATSIGYKALVSQNNSLVLGGTGADAVNVGIGTTTPSATLDISPATGAAVNIKPWGNNPGKTGEIRFNELPGNGSEYVGFKSPDAITTNKIWTLPSSDGASNEVLTTSGGGILSWSAIPAGASAWTRSAPNIYTTTSTDNVGIGTSTPAEVLHLSRNANNNTGIKISNTDLGSISSEGVTFTDEEGDLAGLMVNDNLSTSGAAMTLFNNRTSGFIRFNTLGTTKMTIENGGNVGIGTTSPTTKLEVTASGTSHSIYGNTTGTGKAGYFLVSNAGNSNSALEGGHTGSGVAIAGYNTGTGKAGDFQINNSSSTADAVSIATNGSNSKGLSISHTGISGAATDYGLYVTNTGVAASTANVGGYFSASGATSNYAAIFDLGNVGMGTSTPTARLHVNAGGIKSENSQVGYTGLLTLLNKANATADYGSYLEFTGSGTETQMGKIISGWNAASTADAYMRFDVRGSNSVSEALRITSSGNVGIGTTVPGAKLHVFSSGNSVTEILNENSNSAGSTEINLRTDGGINDKLMLFKGGSTAGGTIDGISLANLSIVSSGATAGPLMVRTITSNSIYFLSNNLTRMTLTGGGNLGIGTTAPVNLLDVEGGIAIGTSYSGTNTAPSNGAIIEGKVGIGLTVPAVKFHVADNSSSAFAGIIAQTNSTSASGLLVKTATNGDAATSVFSARFGNTNDAFNVWSNGKTTIGNQTGAGNTTLEVKGDISATITTIASNATIAVGAFSVVEITGTTQINTINTGFDGKILYLFNTTGPVGAAVLGNGGNIQTCSGANLVSSGAINGWSATLVYQAAPLNKWVVVSFNP